MRAMSFERPVRPLRRLAIRAASLAFVAAVPACPARAQSDPPRPLSLEQTERMLQSGVAVTQIASWARAYCIDFRFTRSAAIRLRDAGADRELLGVLGDACVKEPERAAPVQAPPPPVDARPEPHQQSSERPNGDDERPRTRQVYPDGIEVWRAAGMAAVLPGWPWLTVPERRHVGYAISGGVGLGLIATLEAHMAKSSTRRDYELALATDAPAPILRAKRDAMNGARTRYNVFRMITGAAWLGQVALAVRTWSPQDEPALARVGSGRLYAGVVPVSADGLGLSLSYVAPLPLLGHTPR
jgi:hypothetical protein